MKTKDKGWKTRRRRLLRVMHIGRESLEEEV